MGGGVMRDRADAGRRLAGVLRERSFHRPVVLGLPRGGVPVAAEVSRALGAALDVLLVRKVGHPHQPELALGAVGEGGALALNEDLARLVPAVEIEAGVARERAELERRAGVYRAVRARVDPAGRDAIIVDDGAATGATVRAGIAVARAEGARRVIVALPVAPVETVRALMRDADEVICPLTPASFGSVGQFYADFEQVSDEEVIRRLREASS